MHAIVRPTPPSRQIVVSHRFVTAQSNQDTFWQDAQISSSLLYVLLVVLQEASPTINQEIVATLMEVLLTHDDANRAIEHALKSHDQIQAQEGEADDLKVCIDSAAVLDSRLTAVEWTQIALVALQGTQVIPCSKSAVKASCFWYICTVMSMFPCRLASCLTCYLFLWLRVQLDFVVVVALHPCFRTAIAESRMSTWWLLEFVHPCEGV